MLKKDNKSPPEYKQKDKFFCVLQINPITWCAPTMSQESHAGDKVYYKSHKFKL